jgi:hypothetical protein
MSRAEIMDFHMKRGGHYGEGEFIHTFVATPSEAKKLIKNVNGLLNIHMYQDWKASKGK